MNQASAMELTAHLKFLDLDKDDNHEDKSSETEELRTTPLFSWPVKLYVDALKSRKTENSQTDALFKQYALMGIEVCGIDSSDANGQSSGDASDTSMTQPIVRASPTQPWPIFLNTNAPWSAFICGSQGSGKSYTLSCMLENCLMTRQCLINNQSLMSGILFHYDNHVTDFVCEAAYLASHVKVQVLCSPSNFHSLRKKYAGLSNAIQVHPLLLKDKHLSTARMLRLMSISDKEGSMPLYMEVLVKILKEMAVENAGKTPFRYDTFIKRVQAEAFSRDQKGPMHMRLDLLNSFMETGKLAKNLPGTKKDIFTAQPGFLTIVDLTDPFVDPASACVLFDICLALFLENKSIGKVIALDEAHKFMGQGSASAIFTDHLLSVIREQRHKGARVIIATQEPTISPKLLDLCSMTIVHRFTSPDWLNVLKQHIAGASSAGGHPPSYVQQLFHEIVRLRAGESLLFSPSAVIDMVKGSPTKLGLNKVRFRTRRRITNDGGRSVLASRIE